MPHEMSPGKPTTRRYSEAEKERAVRMVSRQVLCMVVAEAVFISGAGVMLAPVVAVIAVIILWSALMSQAPAIHVAVPWLVIGGIAVACLVTALLASLIPAAVLLRQRPVQLAGLRD